MHNVTDSRLLSVLSDLFINLSAGWFGIIIISPNFMDKKGFRKFFILISDLTFAIFCLEVAYILRINL